MNKTESLPEYYILCIITLQEAIDETIGMEMDSLPIASYPML